MHKPRYSHEEFARRGGDLYESQIRAQVEAGNDGKVVAIDVETGQFEVGDDALTASDRLLAKCPDAQAWFVRIGRSALHRFGPMGPVRKRLPIPYLAEGFRQSHPRHSRA